MKRKFVHIGFPKCASTSLQADFFGSHPEIYFLGVGVNNGRPFPQRYVEDDMAILFEMDLRYRKRNLIDFESAKKLVNKHLAIAENDASKNVVLASNELLSFTFSYDCDVIEKAERLYKVMGAGTEIIVVIRNQFDLIKSMYSEYLKCGSFLSFNEFIEYSHLHDYRFFFSDLLYDKTIEIYEQIFGQSNVHIILFEDMIKEMENGVKAFTSVMGISEYPITVGKQNSSLSYNAIDEIIAYNKANRNNLGNSLHEGAQMQRLYPFLSKEKGDRQYDKVRLDHERRKQIIKIDNYIRQGLDANGKKPGLFKRTRSNNQLLNYSSEQNQLILEYFGDGNAKLAEKRKIDLAQYNYPLK